MALGEEEQAGFALAALLASDRSLEACAAGLPAEDLAQVRALLDPKKNAEPSARLVARLLDRVRPPLRALPANVPVRFVTLLASKLPRSGRAAPTRATPSRALYTPAPELVALLMRIARAASVAQEDR